MAFHSPQMTRCHFTLKFLFYSVHSKDILLQKFYFTSRFPFPFLFFFFFFWMKSVDITSACYIFKELMCSSLYSLLLSSSLSVFSKLLLSSLLQPAWLPGQYFLLSYLIAPSTMKVFIDASFIWPFWFHINNFCLSFFYYFCFYSVCPYSEVFGHSISRSETLQ